MPPRTTSDSTAIAATIVLYRDSQLSAVPA
jgi:hypothetical protein